MSDFNDKEVGEIITADEAAEMLGVSTRRIQWLIETGRARGNVKDGVTYVYEGDVKRYGRSRFIKKNRTRIAAVVALVVVLVGGMGALGVWWQDRENAEKYLNFAEESMKRGDFQNATVYFERVEKIKGKDPETMLRIGRAYMKANMMDRAIGVFEKAEKLDLGEKSAAENLCALYFMKGEMDRAEEKCRRTQELTPGHVFSMYTMGQIYSRRRNFEEAQKLFEEVLKKQPDFYPALEGLAITYSGMNKYDEAAEIFGGEQGSAPMVNRLNYAIQKDKAGERDEAMRVYGEIISNAPAMARAYNNIAWGLVSSERVDDKQLVFAFEMTKKALTLQPGDAAALDTMGWIFFQRGNYEESIQLLEESLKQSADDPAVMAHLIRAKLGAGKKEEAEKLLAKLAMLDPEAHRVLTGLFGGAGE